MPFEIFPFTFRFEPVIFASVAIWTLALYLALTPVSDWLMLQLTRWFNFAERSLYTSAEEYERTRAAREAQNSFYASILSIIPFFALGTLSHYLVDWALGDSWSLSLGILCAIGCGIYELGRRTDSPDER